MADIHSQHKMQILIVDGEVVDQKFYSLVFEPLLESADVFVVANGRDARSVADNCRVNLVISDLDLVDMACSELFEGIKEAHPSGNVAFFVITNKLSSEEAESIQIPNVSKVFTKDYFFRRSNEVVPTMIASMLKSTSSPQTPGSQYGRMDDSLGKLSLNF